MKKGLTELVFILDRSGSMHGLEADTIGGFNSVLQNQKKEEGEALVSTVLFDSSVEVLHDRIPIDRVPDMTNEQYFTRGCTALLDAVGGAIHHIGSIHRYAREEDVPEHTLFVITTDGYENASRNYSYEKVREMIRRQEKKYGWEFLFVGANMDAVKTAAGLGIRPERAANYVPDGQGTELLYEAVGKVACSVRRSAEIDVDWMADMEEDKRRRCHRR